MMCWIVGLPRNRLHTSHGAQNYPALLLQDLDNPMS